MKLFTGQVIIHLFSCSTLKAYSQVRLQGVDVNEHFYCGIRLAS